MINNLVSIIIPVYNAEQYLRSCLDSVAGQSYSKLEIILINDGSKDSSGEICDEYARKDSRFRVIHQQNGGVSKARNVGLNVARGEYFSFIDGDDTIDSSYIELMITEMKKNDVDLVRLSWYRGSKRCTYRVSFDNNGKFLVNEENLNDLLWCANIWGLFRFESLGAIRFDEHLKYAEDNLFVLEYFLRSKHKKMLLVDTPLYHYTIVNSSATNLDVIERLKLSELFVERVLKIDCNVDLLRLTHKYAYQDYLVVFYYFVDNKLNAKDGFCLNDVRKKIISMRREGCREKDFSSMMVSIIYRNHLHVFMQIFRFLRSQWKKRMLLCKKN
jgi:glycosyltransferase involved in cell wall biosynthesis